MIVRFLMEWPEKTPEVEEAIRSAVFKEISKERRDGYSWAGSYARDLLTVVRERGYL